MRPGNLGEGSITPDGALLLKGTKKAARMQKLWQHHSSTLFLLLLLPCLKPWIDHFSRAEVYGLICDTSFAISDAFLIAGQTWEKGATGCSRFSRGGHKPRQWGVRERPVTQSSTGTTIKVQPPGSKTKTFWGGWTGHHFIHQHVPMGKEGQDSHDALLARTCLSFFRSEEKHLNSF